MIEHPPVRIEQMRIPDDFDDAAQELLGRVAGLVRRSRQHVWGISDLTGDAQELYRDLLDPFERVVVLLAWAGDRLAGRAEVRMPLVASTGTAHITVDVDPDVTSQGTGSELLGAAEQLAVGESRRHLRIQTEHPGPEEIQGDGSVTGVFPVITPGMVEWVDAADGSGRLPVSNRQTRFALHAGYRLESVSDFGVLEVPLPPARVQALLREVAASPAPEAYRIHVWTGPAPEERLDELAALHSRMAADSFLAPVEADPEPWDAERVRRTEQLRAEAGNVSLVAVAEHGTTGRLVGMTEIVLAGEDPVIGMQDETVVLREHRRRWLATRLKLANLQQLERLAPAVRTVYSWSHSGDDRMSRVNHRLGFRVAGRSGVWSREFPAA
ncbi:MULTISPECIES: GNAT family N-acetyltransferase [unclassified Kocuria]|uniref:GNAT family N-acetyltransferase n=1 Tax=unclassified Kocuria TaxID=2649579 RepID=UPI00064984CC|nr:MULTISPECIES: GNAT family N-acetyltransferase [unclassified Kocuria]KLU09307.1 acetyltransferase [Kocuria sp. SM24M-10]OLT12606.1 acetyltransferase [Kocuria sp. CNJ-770]